MKLAIEEENYSMAAKLRDEQQVLAKSLPPLLQYMMHHVSKLRTGPLDEQLQAIANLGEAGDEVVLPDLASCLGEKDVHDAAQNAMWAIFMRCKDPRVNELMTEGVAIMGSPFQFERSIKIFEQIIKLQPSYAEGYNKRGTVRYLLGHFEESIEDCKMVLQLQPYHFGAASGMGLCYMKLGKEAEALRAFEAALAINPGMTNIAGLVEQLKRTQKE